MQVIKTSMRRSKSSNDFKEKVLSGFLAMGHVMTMVKKKYFQDYNNLKFAE